MADYGYYDEYDENMYTVLPGGKRFPLLGLGTWLFGNRPWKDGRKAVLRAIACGYRHIDTAYANDNEKEIGKEIKIKMDDRTIKREDIFITAKLWMTCHRSDKIEPSCRESLKNLGLDYVDLYLMNWPMSLPTDKGGYPVDSAGLMLEDRSIDYVDVWKGMECLVDKGLVRAIGVCNFNKTQLQRILDLPPKHPIANLQIESHPFLAQNELIEFCKKHDISVTAYGLLGAPERPRQVYESTYHDPVVMKEHVVCDIAKKRGVSAAQVLIRYQLQRGVAVIPNSVTPSNIEENFEALNFELSKDEMEKLLKLNEDYRLLHAPESKWMKYYPF